MSNTYAENNPKAAKLRTALKLFHEDELVRDYRRKYEKEHLTEKHKTKQLIPTKITDVVENMGLFADDKEKEQFTKELSEYTETTEFDKIMDSPFVKVLLNFGIPLFAKWADMKGILKPNEGANK